MYLRTDADPGDPAVQWAGDLGLFLWAHDRTGEQRFLDRATAMFDAMVLDFTFDEAYPRDFDPFVGLWGYDAQHALFSDYMADKKGLAGASDHLTSQVVWYEARYEAKVEEDHYNAIFTNLIAEWYGIGKRIDKYTFEAEDLWCSTRRSR